MRICHTTFGFPPTVGGTETHNYLLVRYLMQRGYDVDLIALRTNISKEDLIKNSKIPYTNRIRVHNIFPKPFPLWIFQIKKEIKKIEMGGKIDIFDLHSIQDILSFIFQKRKILLSLHFFELNCPGPREVSYPRPCTCSLKGCWRCCGIKRYLWWSFIRWLVIRKTTKFMVKYDYLKRKLMQTGIDGGKIVVVPHWIDVEGINKKSKGNGVSIDNIKSSDYVFIFFGRLATEKGPDILLEAFALLTKKVENAKLVFIGDGPLRGDLEEICDRYNITDRVIFLGMIPHEDLFEYMSLADTLVFPHRYFNYEWALLEAMCTEKPIIATDVPATADILTEGYNALLTEPTPTSLCSKMYNILQNPELGEKIAKNAFKTVREKHTMKNLEKYERLVKGLVNPNERGVS